MKTFYACIALLCSAQVQAESPPLVHWWDASVSALYGENFDLAPSDKQTTITLETAGAWRYGDWFAFQDFTYFNGSNASKSNTTYGEITTRFSVNKIFDTDISFGVVKDISLALQLEEGEGPLETLLYGVGIDFDVPYFNYVKLNSYKKQPLHSGQDDSEWQLSPSFMIELPVGSSNIIIDGYIDWVYNTNTNTDSFHLNPQIKYDLGQVMFNQSSKLLVGIEYDLWLNKYGVEGVDQNTFSFLIKYHL